MFYISYILLAERFIVHDGIYSSVADYNSVRVGVCQSFFMIE